MSGVQSGLGIKPKVNFLILLIWKYTIARCTQRLSGSLAAKLVQMREIEITPDLLFVQQVGFAWLDCMSDARKTFPNFPGFLDWLKVIKRDNGLDFGTSESTFTSENDIQEKLAPIRAGIRRCRYISFWKSKQKTQFLNASGIQKELTMSDGKPFVSWGIGIFQHGHYCI